MKTIQKTMTETKFEIGCKEHCNTLQILNEYETKPGKVLEGEDI